MGYVPTLDARRLGGIATGKIKRQKALERYYAAPNHCKHCAEVIPVKEGKQVYDARRQKFCNKSCAAKFNNTRPVAPKKKPGPPRPCKQCGVEHAVRRATGYNLLCAGCFADMLARALKTQKTETDLPSIRAHARAVMRRSNQPVKCAWCGYDKHVECCHIKKIASFPVTATVGEINALENLKWLCRNCHWELDHGMRTE